MYPFDRPGLPRAEQTIQAPIDRVYGTLDDIRSWPTWLGQFDGPVRTVGSQTYEVDHVDNGTTVVRRFTVTSRGPVHTLFLDVDDGACGVYFRTRPRSSGTRTEVVLTLPEERGVRAALRRGRRTKQAAARLEVFIAALAAHLEADPS